MNPDQLATITKLVFSMWTRPEVTDDATVLFTAGVADLPFQETVNVIRSLQRVEHFRPSVAQIRKQVFGAAGVLPPSLDTALASASEWVESMEQRAFVNTTGYDPPKPKPLHPVVEQVVRSIDTTHPSWRATFSKNYRRAASAEVRRVTATDFDQLTLGRGE